MKIVQEIFVPQDSVNDQSVVVVELNFKNGDRVKKNDIIAELENSKAIVTIEAETDGYVIYHCSVGDEVAVNKLIIQIADTKPELVSQAGNIISPGDNNILAAPAKKIKEHETQFSKKALLLIQENKLSKTIFEDHDFVNEATILAYLDPEREKKKSVAGQPVETAIKPSTQMKNVVYEKISPAKKREIEYLSSVEHNGLMSTLYISINARSVMNRLNKRLAFFKNSILVPVVLESSKLLLKYPLLNAFFENNQIARYTSVNVGIAIDMDNGLKVVKLPDTERLDINQIESMIFELSNKYLDRKLGVKELSEISFTITDISGSNVSFFTPLINKNNSAIMGISKMDEKSGTCIVSLSFDHRVTEGKYAGNFLTELKSRIESFSIPGEATGPVMVCYKCLKEISEDLNDKGFIKVQTRDGDEKLICDTCLFNF